MLTLKEKQIFQLILICDKTKSFFEEYYIKKLIYLLIYN